MKTKPNPYPSGKPKNYVILENGDISATEIINFGEKNNAINQDGKVLVAFGDDDNNPSLHTEKSLTSKWNSEL
ncbi:MAG: hypothetical protein PHZ07_01810 [Patescibacteria group bacterium]|nr:hypothetical protein [Patescibacteria group bacterium]MDD4304078.1 hypothetical protein [Patescibacteria group bacterium]MDD4694955.1 hypothetical protein [Patescibacteria group bacterium]